MDLGIATLRKSFSIIIEAVELVKTGPYKYVKHPIYLGEFITVFAYTLAANKLMGCILYIILLWLMYFRMRMEENKLMRAFPDEEKYFKNTSSLLPIRYIIKKLKRNSDIVG
ncbi:MAG: methyltransferase family protein [Promethearchaeota archaeon]